MREMPVNIIIGLINYSFGGIGAFAISYEVPFGLEMDTFEFSRNCQ